MRKQVGLLPAFALLSIAAIAQPTPNPVPDTGLITKPDKAITHHTIKVEGKPITYTAIAGTLLLKNDKDEAMALIGLTLFNIRGIAEEGHGLVLIVL